MAPTAFTGADVNSVREPTTKNIDGASIALGHLARGGVQKPTSGFQCIQRGFSVGLRAWELEENNPQRV